MNGRRARAGSARRVLLLLFAACRPDPSLPSENAVNKNKYMIGLIGLAVGFAVSFFLTTNYNKTNAPMAAAQPPSPGAAPGSGAQGAGNQQAMMGNVAATIEKAKNNPKDFKAQVDAAKVYNQIDRTGDAVEYLKKAYAIDPNKFSKGGDPELQGALIYVSQYYMEQQNYPEAEAWLRRSVEVEPDQPTLYVAIADTLIQRNPPEPDKAIQELQRALKADPKNAHALGHMVEAYALKKDARGAEDALNRLKEADASNQRIAALETLLADLKAGKPVVLPKE
jgi:tetratricopeptide (TPR) repeat protein